MSKTDKYLSIPLEVRAVLWDGSNLLEIQKFLGKAFYYAKFLIKNNAPYSIIFRTTTGLLEARQGEYIIKESDTNHYLCEAEEFKKRFKKL